MLWDVWSTTMWGPLGTPSLCPILRRAVSKTMSGTDDGEAGGGEGEAARVRGRVAEAVVDAARAGAGPGRAYSARRHHAH
eukprot:3931187-Rhodomonas_salina.1